MGIFDRFRKSKDLEKPKNSKINIVNVPSKKMAFSSDIYNNGFFSSQTGGAKYAGGLPGSGYSHFINNRLTRTNARNAYHDTPEAKALVNRFADTVVDTGLRLECTPQADILGITQAEAEEWGRKVQTLFHLWAKSKKSSRNGINTFYQNQRLYAINQHRDNDCFVRMHYSNDKKLTNPLQLSFIEPNQIQGDEFFSTYGHNFSSDGIERNEKGEEIAYNVYIKDYKKNESNFITIPAKGKRSGRIMMVHGFMPEYFSQGRGYSPMEHVLQEFSDVTDFKISNIKKAINQSQITMYVKPSEENDSSNPLEDISNFNRSGPAEAAFFDNEGDLEIQRVVDDCVLDFEPVPEATLRTPGSVGVFNLKKGEDLRPFETQQNTEAHSQFVDSYLSYVSASRGMPIEVLKMQFGQNYSASRGSLLLFWRIAEIWRKEMGDDFLNPTFESWLSEEIARGKIKAPGFSDPVMREAWLDCRWIGAPMPNIDPMRTAKADMLYVEMGAQDLDRVAQNYNGSDGRTNRQKLKSQFPELPFAKWNLTPSEMDGEDHSEDDDDKSS